MTCSRLTWLVLCLMVAPMVQSVQTGWRPIPGPGPSLAPGPTLGSLPSPIIPRTLFHSHLPRPHPACTLYKAVFDQDTFQQEEPMYQVLSLLDLSIKGYLTDRWRDCPDLRVENEYSSSLDK
ncbi:hypothetical protein J6590_047399 [Homalodisca vitripennis]|nr:hypothetical protein J6590_047399 [Homalodisca vitripennis]